MSRLEVNPERVSRALSAKAGHVNRSKLNYEYGLVNDKLKRSATGMLSHFCFGHRNFTARGSYPQ